MSEEQTWEEWQEDRQINLAFLETHNIPRLLQALIKAPSKTDAKQELKELAQAKQELQELIEAGGIEVGLVRHKTMLATISELENSALIGKPDTTLPPKHWSEQAEPPENDPAFIAAFYHERLDRLSNPDEAARWQNRNQAQINAHLKRMMCHLKALLLAGTINDLLTALIEKSTPAISTILARLITDANNLRQVLDQNKEEKGIGDLSEDEQTAHAAFQLIALLSPNEQSV